jgi:hypothetical protein
MILDVGLLKICEKSEFPIEEFETLKFFKLL